MASLKSIVEKYGIPVRVRCITKGVKPFIIIKDDGDSYTVDYRDKYYGIRSGILKECPTCDDYKYDGVEEK